MTITSESSCKPNAGSKSLQDQILQALRDSPGQKARELAAALNCDKSEVNTTLYDHLSEACTQDELYRWYLTEDAPTKLKISSKDIPKTALGNLVNYYLACLGRDDEGGISVYADNKFGDLDYVELSTLPQKNNRKFLESDAAKKLLSKVQKERGKLEMYLGYPTALQKVQSKKSSWVGCFVQPLILFPIDTSSGSPVLTDDFPSINIPLLKRLTNVEQELVMNEVIQLEHELGLSSDGEFPDIDELVRRLANIRKEWPWKESINPDSLLLKPTLRVVKEEGLFNRAVLVVAQRSPFTKGLETELKTLSEMEPHKYEKTALGHWIRGELPDDTKYSSLPLLEVLPLNSEQREAVQHALSHPLTVITGPPGTGKSQVVTNLLINATWHGKKVLYASKNNKAVDVVEVRLNNLGARPILLRMGSQHYQAKLAEYLMGILTAPCLKHEQDEFDCDLKRFKQLENQYQQLDLQESQLIRLRNELDEVDQSLDKFRNHLSDDVFLALRTMDTNNVKNLLRDCSVAYKSAIQKNSGLVSRWLSKYTKNARYKRFAAAIECIKPIAKSLEIQVPNKSPGEENINDWKEFLDELEYYCERKELIDEYHALLKRLKNTRPLEDILKERMLLLEEMANNADNIWKGWLRLEPSRLTSQDRQLLNQYNALLKMVIDTKGDLESGLNKKVYTEYMSLSKKVAHLLPAWAVTSLSAKGRVPFVPGYFDLVVFDEASQCDIASALPLLYRAKQAVVIGDPKQLRHISTLQQGKDQQFLDKYGLIPDYVHWSYSYNSLYDLASGLVGAQDIISLRDHHRSHADIIEFSNKEFYEGSLRIATNYNALKVVGLGEQGIRWINVVGEARRPVEGGAVNQPEAQAIVKELRRLVLQQEYEGSIGIVTPFRAQANLIRKQVELDKELSIKLVDHDFLVDTVHKFQGDERDVMIFSPVVSRNIPEGALNYMQNNGNLFNVAITRARALLLVVGDQGATVSCDVSYLRNFAAYAKQLEELKTVQDEQIITKLGREYPQVAHSELVSDWEPILYEALYVAGIKTIPQYKVEKYSLDLALISGKRMLDIEVDGERYHRSWTGELCRRDQIRNYRLFELGWDVKRFWVPEVRDDLDGCVRKVKEWLEVKD